MHGGAVGGDESRENMEIDREVLGGGNRTEDIGANATQPDEQLRKRNDEQEKGTDDAGKSGDLSPGAQKAKDDA